MTHLLCVPTIFDVSWNICRWHGTDNQCIKPMGYTVNIKRDWCGQCCVVVMNLISQRNILLNTQNARSFKGICHGIMLKRDNMKYFIKDKKTFERTINTFLFLIEWSQQRNQEIDDIAFQKHIDSFLQFSKSKKVFSWLIKINNGSIFKRLAIDSWNKYSPCTNNDDKPYLVPCKFEYWYMWHTITFIYRYTYYFHQKIQKIKHNKNGKYSNMHSRVKRNYLWIENVTNNHDLEFHFCPNGVREINKEWKEQKNNQRFCDNPECKVTFKDWNNKWYRCKKCRIINYCSRRCQKIDWNRYNHKNICFPYITKTN